MPVFAVVLPEEKVVSSWVKRVSGRLGSPDFVRSPFHGVAREYDGGLWVLEASPVYPRIVPLIGALSISIGSAMSYFVGWYTVAKVLVAVAAGIVLLWECWWHPFLYQVVLSVQASRLCGRWVWAKRAEREALWRLAHGKG